MVSSHWQPGIWCGEDIATYTPTDVLTEFREAKGETLIKDRESCRQSEKQWVPPCHRYSLRWDLRDGWLRWEGQWWKTPELPHGAKEWQGDVNGEQQTHKGDGRKWNRLNPNTFNRRWITTTRYWTSGPLPAEWGIWIHIYHHQQHHHVALWCNTQTPDGEATSRPKVQGWSVQGGETASAWFTYSPALTRILNMLLLRVFVSPWVKRR